MHDEQTWHRVLDIIAQYNRPIVVVSATARTTRQLLSAAETALKDVSSAYSISKAISRRHKELVSNFLSNYSTAQESEKKCIQWIDERISNLNQDLEQVAGDGCLSPKMEDAIASRGEQLSSYLFALCGSVYGLNTRWIDARRVIKTDSDFGKANPDIQKIDQTSTVLSKAIEQDSIPVMGGFYGEDANCNITTLGFEGSDYTASLIGAALNVKAIEIWTDVSGIFTCDPRTVPEAESIPELSFQEATELAYFGAKVLHPSTMKPASKKNIPIFVKSIFEADHPGTMIHAQAPPDGMVRALTFIEDVTIFTVASSRSLMGYQFLSQVFARLEELRIPVDVVTTTEASVSVALATSSQTDTITSSLNELGNVTITNQQALISLVGCRFPDASFITSKVMGVLPRSELSMLSYCQTRGNLNLVLPQAKLQDSVKAIHTAVFQEA